MGWAAVSEDLARDGLARVERTPQGIVVGLEGEQAELRNAPYLEHN
jgi:hypothetical protein